MLVDETEFRLELPDTWTRAPNPDSVELRRGEEERITINTLLVSDDKQPGQALDALVEAMREGVKKADRRVKLETVKLEQRPSCLVRTFVARPRTGGTLFNGFIASTRSVAGNHVLLMFAYVGSSDADAAAIFQKLQFMPNADAVARFEAKTDAPLDLARIYPYIVPRSYLEAGPKTPVRELGHDLLVFLAEDLDGVCRVFGAEDITAAGHALDEVVARANANLEALLNTQAIPTMMWPVDGGRFMRLGDHWLAAACMVLPYAMTFVAKFLAVEQFDAVIPHRDVLLCFAGPAKAVRKIRKSIRAEEADGRKLLSWGVFRVEAGSPRALDDHL